MTWQWRFLADLTGPPGDALAMGRFGAIEAKNTQQDGRLDSVEAKNTSQDAALTDHGSRLGQVEGKNTEQDGRLGQVETLNSEQQVRLGRVDNTSLWATSSSDYNMLFVDPTGRIAEPAAVDASGNTPDWVLERWSERMADYLRADLGIKPRTAIAAFGDSMVERYQNVGGQSWTDVVSAALGVRVENLGKSGQSTTEIAVRTGAVPFHATVFGNTIPASGAVGLTAYTPKTFWRTTLQHDYPGTLAGVHGFLRQNIADPATFHFWRDEPGNAVPCPPGTLFISDQAKYRKWTNIIWMGRNNITEGFVQQAIADIDAVIAAIPFTDKRFMVLSVCNAQYESAGSTGHARVLEINNHLATKYPAQYLDVRAWLINNALAAMGLTPTAADTTAIAEDRIPPQLMQDNLHITEAAGLALGTYIASTITARELLK